MNMKNMTLEIAVVLACYLVITIPVASATTINIKFNGQVMESVEYEPSNIVNQHITYVRDARDISWTNVRVAITLNSASLAHTIKRVYLYKCGSLSPVGCMQKTPEVFDTYVDTEIAWDDIGQSTGTSKYPQEGNLLFLVKLEDPDGLTSWVGLWNTIRRNSHKEFLFYRHELSDVDVYASSSRLVGPIASYIQNFNVIPFGWLTKVAFDDALSISAIGGDDSDLDTSPPSLQTAEPSTNEITVINKENYFVFPETAGGTAFPITLEQNPDFQCGDGQCESSLGENEETCCYDCGCEQSGYYCDAPPDSPEDGACRDESLIGLDVVGTPTADISDCSQSFEVGVTTEISSTPASMEEDLSAIVTADGKNYGAQCTESSQGRYQCVFTMSPTIECGSVDKSIASNELKLTINYKDGSERVTRDLTEALPTISLNYDCSCPDDGDYCDTGTETCEPEDSITLSITELNSYLSPYNPGDTIDLTAKISNPPTGTVLMSASANFTLTGGDVYPGSPECTGPSDDYEYECSIQFSITGYSKENDYKFYPNYLTFDITYNDGPDAATRILTTEFGPISIPNQDCGNGVCDADETTDTCCQDCGCEESDYYCDVSRGCSSLDDITLSTTTYPVEFEDCTESHEVELQATIENAPYGVTLDYTSITVDNQPVSWGFDCTSQVGGVFNCDLGIPPIEGCELPYYTLGPNGLTFTISFPNGDDDYSSLTKELNAAFDSIYITPVPHIDGDCEAELGENGSTACLDCPCDEDAYFISLGGEYYCDASSSNPGGTCLPKNDVALVVESPTSPVTFDSCEKYNKLSVLMHVRNQPSGMDAENVYATLGGAAASYVSCKESAGTYLDSNITFNCSIRVPPIDTCTQGQTYNHTNNSISLIISYDNGEQGTVLQTLDHDLPDVYIHQTYRSLHEITENAMEQMTGVLDRIMQITEDTMDVIYKCIELQIAAFLITLVGSMVMGYYGAKSYKGVEGKTGFDGFAEGMKTGGIVGTQLSTMIGQICDALEKIQQIMIKYQELLMEKIKMEMCLSLMQHAMDSGDCKGNEEGCFDKIIGCLSNLKDMTDIMDDIDKLTDGINQDFVAANNAIAKAADALGDSPWSKVGKETLFYVYLGGTRLTDGDQVCKYTGEWTWDKGCTKVEKRTGYVTIAVKSEYCNKKYVYLTVNEDPVYTITKEENKDVDVTKKSFNAGETDLFEVLRDGQKNTFSLFCSDRSSFSFYGTDPGDYDKIGADFIFIEGDYIERDSDNNYFCKCEYEEEYFTYIKGKATDKTGNEELKKKAEDMGCEACTGDNAWDNEATFSPTKQLPIFKSLPGDYEEEKDKESNTNRYCYIKTSYKLTPYVSSGEPSIDKNDDGTKYEFWKVIVDNVDDDCRDLTGGKSIVWVPAAKCGGTKECYLKKK